MAKVILTIEDEGKSVLITLSSDPAFPSPAAEDQTQTIAQSLGCLAMVAVGEVCRREGGEEFEEEDEL